MSNRTAELVGDLLARVHALIAQNDVSYEEYRAAKEWLIELGEAGEWPLLLDVFVESAVEKQAATGRIGSDGTILGPYYLPDAPVLEAPYELPRRPDEPGERLVMTGRVSDAGGTPIRGAVLDVWHADAHGLYSGFSEIPAGILRGKLITGVDGRFELRTILPAPYTIPHNGPTGRMIGACGWHPWRPAHIHLLVSAEGYDLLTTQLYMDTSDYLDDDVASAVKDSLVVHPEPRPGDPGAGIDYPHVHFDYDFRLTPVRTAALVG
jgi:catechol 1,2-dioxygenase